MAIRFQLGKVVMTRGVAEIAGRTNLRGYLIRHSQGDWGTVCSEDKKANDQAVRDGDRILSAYPIDPAQPCKGHGENVVWIITEADRSVTTLLLPDEY